MYEIERTVDVEVVNLIKNIHTNYPSSRGGNSRASRDSFICLLVP